MLYNLGAGGLAEFQNMRRAIIAGDWETAAAESERGDIGEERNRYVFDLFMEVAADDDNVVEEED
jgi:GH24 family phage-related lysozyme (muramidase)